MIKGTIKRHTEEWYICTLTTQTAQNTHRIATGYGTTHTNALQDAFRELNKFGNK